jgi:hypothetical protein
MVLRQTGAHTRTEGKGQKLDVLHSIENRYIIPLGKLVCTGSQFTCQPGRDHQYWSMKLCS